MWGLLLCDILNSTGAGESTQRNHQLNCDDRCFIYFLTCKQRDKEYTGETMHNFRYRWNTCKSNSGKFDRKESCMQEHLYRHFSSTYHTRFLNDVPNTLRDKTLDGCMDG